MERHTRSFFGQKIGMIYDSGSWEYECIYLTFIRKLEDGTWEKPSKGMGKKIKLNLGEQILVTKVLMGMKSKWTTVHSFKDKTTSISVELNNKGNVWIRAGPYNKRISTPETDILLMMMEHVIKEKIEHSTSLKYEKEVKSAPIVVSKEQLEAVVSE